MADIDAWAGNAFPLPDWRDDLDPAVDGARIIADQITSITVIRGGVAQTAQNVRVEEMRGDGAVVSQAGETVIANAIVIGYKSHPGITDTDLQRGDRFAVDGVQYEIISLVSGLSDQLQAFAKERK